MGEKKGPLFRKDCVFDVSRAVRIPRFESESLREAKPGGFQTGGFKGPDCVTDPFGTVPRRCS